METIIDNSGDKSYFTQICNFVDDLDLSIVAYRLYAHYKRVSGEKGKKAKVGVRTLAKKFKVGFETIQKAKKELIDHKLIIVQSFPAKENRPDEVEIIDVWHRNFEHFSKPQPVSNKEQAKKKPVTKQKQVKQKPVSNEEQPRSCGETPPVSPQEQKNNLSKELEEEISLSPRERENLFDEASEIVGGVTPTEETEEQSFAETVVDGLKERMNGLNILPNEDSWLKTIEWARKNKYPPEHCLEIYDLLVKIRDYQNGSWDIKPSFWEGNMPQINKLRREVEIFEAGGLKQNGTRITGRSGNGNGYKQSPDAGREQRTEQIDAIIADSNERFTRPTLE